MGRCLDDVVVGVDGSDASIDAIRWALAHVRPHGHVHAVHVIGPAEELALDAALGDSVALQRHREHELRELWIPKARTVADLETDVEPLVLEGAVADRLLGVARGVGADVVAVGHHEQARGPQLVGHVTATLLRHLELPLAIVPLGWVPGDDHRPVAIGVGVSRGTTAAVRWVMEHESVAGAGVLLVHALGPRSVFRPDGWLDAVAYHLDPTVLPTWVEQDLLDAAEDVRSRTGADVDVAIAVQPGRTGARLAEAGAAARLLVIGRGEPPFVRRHTIAPYLRHVIVHAPCPILVVPAPAET